MGITSYGASVIIRDFIGSNSVGNKNDGLPAMLAFIPSYGCKSSIRLLRCNLTDIHSISGAIFVSKIAGDYEMDVIVDEVRVSNCKGEISGMCAIGDSTVQIVNSLFQYNVAPPSDKFVSSTVILDGLGRQPKVENTRFENNVAYSGTPGIQAGTGDSLLISNCLFSGNKGKYGPLFAQRPVTLFKTTFENNVATSSGGAIYALDTIYVSSRTLVLRNNSAKQTGGAIYLSQASLLYTSRSSDPTHPLRLVL